MTICGMDIVATLKYTKLEDGFLTIDSGLASERTVKIQNPFTHLEPFL